MQIAKISNSTPDPQGGIIEKKDGELTGVFYNHRAMDMLRIYAPPVGADKVRRAVLETQTVEESLRAHTYEGAYAGHQENVKGTLEAGKFADLVVWPDDPARISLCCCA